MGAGLGAATTGATENTQGKKGGPHHEVGPTKGSTPHHYKKRKGAPLIITRARRLVTCHVEIHGVAASRRLDDGEDTGPRLIFVADGGFW